MGPEATVDFMAEILAATPATEDQDHLRLLVDQNPQLPSRQLALAGAGESPGPQLAAMAQGLERGGADFLVMPCNTAHAYRDEMVAHNFEIGRRFFSYERIRRSLNAILETPRPMLGT